MANPSRPAGSWSEAAIETLRARGLRRVPAPGAIAERAEHRPGADLLPLRLQWPTSCWPPWTPSVRSAWSNYGAALEDVGLPAQLVDVARGIFSEDLDAGYVTVLAEMIAGASATPGLGPEVAARIGPWTAFAQQAIDTMLGDSPVGQRCCRRRMSRTESWPCIWGWRCSAISTAIGALPSHCSPMPANWPGSSPRWAAPRLDRHPQPRRHHEYQHHRCHATPCRTPPSTTPASMW